MSAEIKLSLSPSGGLQATARSAKGNDLTVELPPNASEAMTVLYRMLLAASRQGKGSLASPQHPTDTMARDLSDPRWGNLKPVRYGMGSNAKPLPANAAELDL